jgi:Uma2 family endonuclease
MSMPAIEIHRFTREEYERMAEAGFFPPKERVELIDGVIYNLSPQNSRHATAVLLAETALRAVFAHGYCIRVQMPLALDSGSAPEPDVAVVAGSPRDYRDAHPTRALLVMEVADASLGHDRQRKAPLYAHAGIPQYLLLDLNRESLELFSDPVSGIYRRHQTFKRGERVPLGDLSGAFLDVADLLP